MLEKNSTLQYLSISSLHKFNLRAVQLLQESLSANTGLKLVDLKRTTRPFLFSMDHGANLLREEMHRPRIMFMHDSVFLQAVHPNEDLDTLQRRPSFSNRKKVNKRSNSSVAASSSKKMSRTPDHPL
jgi:hypothetical protein